MNNMGFFNPFGGSGSGGGGGGSTANYSVQAVTDSSGQVSYKLTKNGTAVGDVISFNGSNMLVNYGGELVVLNSAIAGIEEALDKTYNFTTFTELEIDTHNKTLTQITDELLTKNLPQNTIVTGQIYTDALPFSGNGEAEVLVNQSALWWTCKSLTTAPYSWTALTASQSLGGVIYDWIPSNYELPIASSSTLGGVKVGENVQIAPDGTISVITTKGDTGTGIASIAKTSSSGLNDIYTITYTDSTTSTFTVTNGATITGGSIGQTGHLILTMSDGRTIDAGALPTDNEVEVTTTSSQPADPNVELWVDLSTQQTLSIPEINDSSTSSTQDTWSCKKIYDEQQKQEEEIGAVANAGAKNWLNTADYIVSSGSGVTITENGDGTFNLSGTPTATTDYLYTPTNQFNNLYGLQKGERYIISTGDNTGKVLIRINASYDGKSFDFSSPLVSNLAGSAAFTIPSNVVGILIDFRSTTRAGSLYGIVLKPMIRPASITDSTFQPYALPNPTLTPAVIKAVDEGAKNLFDIATPDTTRDTVVTPITDGGATISCSDKAWTQYVKSVSVTVGKQYTFSAKIESLTGTSSGKFKIFIRDGSSSGSNLAELAINENGNYNATITPTQNTVSICIYINNDSTARTASANVYGMICTAADWAVSQKFVPYCPINRELYETKAEKTEIHDLLANITSSSMLTAYVDSLARGHYISFVANTDRPTDVPVFDNMFVEIYIYSTNTALIRAFPTGTVYVNQFFQKSKVSGVWRDWNKFEGTEVT